MTNKENLTLFIGEIPSTRLGNIWIALSKRGLVAVEFQVDQEAFSSWLKSRMKNMVVDVVTDEGRTAEAREQLVEYLNGTRQDFTVPIDWSFLTPFQEDVLRITYAIPYGKTITYGEIAHSLGKTKAARAVGRAEATNPMPLVIPCHRVVGSDGGLHGYGGPGGIETKAWLLQLECSG
jgi:methylated-DNA-[protein]-cysteine S-methyltransferase